MAPVLNTRPDGDDEDPRPTEQPRLGEAEDSKEDKPKPEPDTDPMALDDQSPQPTEQSPLIEAEDEPADFVEERLRCLICMEEGHSVMSCPLMWFCPPETAVNDLAEIVCYCCCERIDSGVHANIPDMTSTAHPPVAKMHARCRHKSLGAGAPYQTTTVLE